MPDLQVHEKIRENPIGEKKERSKPSETQKKWKPTKLTYEERKAALKVIASTNSTSSFLPARTPDLLSLVMQMCSSCESQDREIEKPLLSWAALSYRDPLRGVRQ